MGGRKGNLPQRRLLKGKYNDLRFQQRYNNSKDYPLASEVRISVFRSDYDSWDALSKDNEAYRREKARIGQEVIRATEERFTQMKGKLELLDVCTPKTFERYCNAYRGSFMAFLPTINGKLMDHSGKIKGLKNIFLSGQWLQPPGGLPITVITGKDTIMRICKKERKPFASSN